MNRPGADGYSAGSVTLDQHFGNIGYLRTAVTEIQHGMYVYWTIQWLRRFNTLFAGIACCD